MRRRVLVTGGREYAEKDVVFGTLSHLHYQRRITLLIHGGARGADTLAGEWAKWMQVPCLAHYAIWNLDQYNGQDNNPYAVSRQMKRAGRERNEAMLKWKPDLVVAFPGNNGTAHMVSIARKADIELLEVK